jgi:hypothetical protein
MLAYKRDNVFMMVSNNYDKRISMNQAVYRNFLLLLFINIFATIYTGCSHPDHYTGAGLRVNNAYDRVSGFNAEFIKSEDYVIHRKSDVKNAMLLFNETAGYSVYPIGKLIFRKLRQDDINFTFYNFLKSKTADLGGELAVIKKNEMVGETLTVELYVFSK